MRIQDSFPWAYAYLEPGSLRMSIYCYESTDDVEASFAKEHPRLSKDAPRAADISYNSLVSVNSGLRFYFFGETSFLVDFCKNQFKHRFIFTDEEGNRCVSDYVN